ncbi:MAG TPA: GNAT family N-acetyltransferase, partial [Isosphaeraceae bacterium]|nr:GNAT family N-acetyltransferase [Isosphaeraceae bacterium]
APRHAEFHRSIAVELALRGEVCLARLSYGDQPLAVLYGHRFGSKFHSYQMGSTRESTLYRSPGVAVHLELMRHLCERGIVEYDHLSGFNRLKRDYAKHQHSLVHLKVIKPTVAGATFWATDLARRAVRRGLRVFSRPSPGLSEEAGEEGAEPGDAGERQDAERVGISKNSVGPQDVQPLSPSVPTLRDSEVS